MSAMVAISHVLFDMDGLLLDTELVYTQVTQSIVGRFGKVFDWTVKSNMIGRPAKDSSRYLVAALELPITPEEYLEERNALLKQGFSDCTAMPGAERLIRHLHQHRVPIAVATSSNQELYQIKTALHRSWFDLFDKEVTGDDPEIKHGKPAPDIFNVAANRINANPESTLVFEDAPSGLAAGLAANMRVVVVPDPNMDKSRYLGADLILDSLEEFDPAAYQLPGIK